MKKNVVLFSLFFFMSMAIAFSLYHILRSSYTSGSVKNEGPIPFIRKSNYYTESDTIKGIQANGNMGVTESVAVIMERQKRNKLIRKVKEEEPEIIRPDLTKLQQNPDLIDFSQDGPLIPTPQTIGTKFHATELDPVNWLFPADNMGAVGPTQIFVTVNNKFKTFNKSTGIADGAIDVFPDVFFNSVRNNSGTSDPRVRYDRATGKWFVVMINVANTQNRILLAVSSEGTITSTTNFTFFYIQVPGNKDFLDYPTLGIDINALYIGGNIFTLKGINYSFSRTDGYVVKKSSILNTGPISYTLFGSLATSNSAGPYTPQGVDNFDANPTYGYFIGPDILYYSRLQIRRVNNPGGTPTISSNFTINTTATSGSYTVPHLGNTGGTNGYLDALDFRLYSAVIRNGNLWTSHNINVDNTGTANTLGRNREAVRWYQIQNLESTPAIAQLGTIYDNASSNPMSYFIPTVMVTGQGHSAITFTRAGAGNYIDMGFAGRLNSDALNTMGTPVMITSSTTSYNPSNDAGGLNGRRWGDYSFISLDPEDDMTMWAVHGYCSTTNIWGVYAAQLKAPPPATPVAANPSTVYTGLSSTIVTITGTSVNGSGFFDPGTGFSKHISASLTGGITVNSVTYNSPTQVTLDLNTVNASSRANIDVTIINPDGQTLTATNLFQSTYPVELASFTSNISGRNVKLNWITASEENNSGFEIQKTEYRSQETEVWNKIGFIKGSGTKNSPTNYSFEERNLQTGKYKYRLKQIDYNGNYEYFELAGVLEVGVPAKFDLSQNYPNPFNPVTNINFDIPQSGFVTLKVYDLLGKEVATVINENINTGYYTVSFDAAGLSSGVYFYRLNANGFSDVKRLVVLK